MATWFDEVWDQNVRFGLRVEAHLHSERSEFQQIDIFETAAFGRVLALDGVYQTTVGDEFHYHEMLVHPALCTAPRIDNVLIIGGGDGGTAREVLRHPEVQHVTLAELDVAVVDACKQHMGEMNVPWDDPRLTLACGDGVAFLRDAKAGAFDVILVDGPDPVGPAAGLFQSPFYEDCKRCLGDSGVLASQIEGPHLMAADFDRIVHTLRGVFTRADPYFGPVPTYVSGFWAYALCSERVDRRELFGSRVERIEANSRYWNREIHAATFAMPNGIKRRLRR